MIEQEQVQQKKQGWEQGYRESLIRAIIKIVTENPDKVHTVDLEDAYVALQVLRDEEGNILKDDFLDM